GLSFGTIPPPSSPLEKTFFAISMTAPLRNSGSPMTASCSSSHRVRVIVSSG
ncbi:unnamed protein product, partial [Trichogramma brassicae]